MIKEIVQISRMSLALIHKLYCSSKGSIAFFPPFSFWSLKKIKYHFLEIRTVGSRTPILVVVGAPKIATRTPWQMPCIDMQP
jgi:hypothetical protein